MQGKIWGVVLALVAMRPLLPTTTAGAPGSVKPVTRCAPLAPASQISAARYQVFGRPRRRWAAT